MRLFPERHTDKDGECRLFFKGYLHGIQVRLTTDIKVKRQAWHQKSQRVLPNLGQLALNETNDIIELYRDHMRRVWLKAKQQGWTVERFKSEFYTSTKTANAERRSLDFFHAFDLLKELNEGELAQGYLRKFTTVKKLLHKYDPGLTFHDLNKNRLNEIVRHWRKTGMTNNTIANHFKMIKLVMAYASERIAGIPQDCAKYTIQRHRASVIVPTADQVSRIEAVQLTGTEDMVRDLFLFRCFTGLRHSDIKQLTRHHFKQVNGEWHMDFIIVKQDRPHSIWVRPKALRILQKYDFELPKFSEQAENRLLKVIAKKAALFERVIVSKKVGKDTIYRYSQEEGKQTEFPFFHEILATHHARRFFARSWYDRKGDLLSLSRFLGHSSIEMTLQYIGLQMAEVNEEAKKIFADEDTS